MTASQSLLHQISHYYGSRLVLDDITLSAKPGEVVALMGPSGCGKTTLLNLLAGVLAPTMGEIGVVPRDIAYVFQEPCLFPWYTVTENIALGLTAQGMGPRRRHQIARGLAETVGLATAAQLYPDQLSGGMKQRVNLARAFAVTPQLLLLDEPFGSLDMGTRQQLQQLLIHWVQQHHTTAILVTHDLAEAVIMGDRLLVLSPSPARIVYQWQSDRPHLNRDPAYVYQTLSELQTIPTIAASFNLHGN
ncbi:MAG: ABC transporter ATP-binding protein [Cyanothece sp. SIO2G6]|nr:ABC transporter ATP-binding protein [Cyanothece sp. SIO2G6]